MVHTQVTHDTISDVTVSITRHDNYISTYIAQHKKNLGKVPVSEQLVSVALNQIRHHKGQLMREIETHTHSLQEKASESFKP